MAKLMTQNGEGVRLFIFTLNRQLEQHLFPSVQISSFKDKSNYVFQRSPSHNTEEQKITVHLSEGGRKDGVTAVVNFFLQLQWKLASQFINILNFCLVKNENRTILNLELNTGSNSSPLSPPVLACSNKRAETTRAGRQKTTHVKGILQYTGEVFGGDSCPLCQECSVLIFSLRIKCTS